MSKERIKIKDITEESKSPKSHHSSSNHIYVRASKGIYQQLRKKVGWFFMLLFLLIPWINYGDRQAILLDIGGQKFNFFSVTLWPQDLTLLALLFMIAAFALFFITTFLGRVWCGYMCPQTVWTFIYIWFEEKIEGAANKRKKQDQLPLTGSILQKKLLKHLAWIFVALITGLTFVGYFIPVKQLITDFITLNSTFWPTFWILFFAACTYFNAGWMRSIVCTHMCPYARFQSAMFDQDTFIVGYDAKRGESRGPRSRKTDPETLGLGDCIDCDLCVQVCPTGIDIRDGLQYECINCGACIDACDTTMQRMNYKKGLINYTTEHRLLGIETKVLRPKLLGYGAILILMAGLFISHLLTIEPMGLDVIRDRNQLSQQNSQGLVENSYTLKLLNKTQHPQTFELSITGLPEYQWYGEKKVDLRAGEVFSLPISIGVEPRDLKQPVTIIQFSLSNGDEQLMTESRFIKQL
ncbi:cytochrome c oxidase accessory protein CcoG [Vibrio sp. SS-MA-C1-2]|uniref:cytochrome c oxidase accessory protein CcoG n=1 Tax=Vibrio sp. SS-MA-C1-2 TaxID=2908646 RepID=UPI001F1AF7A1|nr:cytochrome c oxidase accessory protein CcoG [Vibrio sp. SS-MA-C1-2]UJF19350.1 cytochrome c oxidase accessory protein CcoG [Vibrio sp. SS-MA-C1-2]